MIVIDTSVIYALLDRRDRRHTEAATWYARTDEELATTPLVLAETDHLTLTRAGQNAAHAFRQDVESGAYLVEWWPTAEVEVVRIAEQYRDLALGLTDASLVALAARLQTRVIATFDERHFRAVRPVTEDDAFVLVPIDER